MISRTELTTPYSLGMTLPERIELLRSDNIQQTTITEDYQRALRRLKRWKEQSPFKSNGWFEKRLLIDSITEDELLRLLISPIQVETDHMPDTQTWVEMLFNIYEVPYEDDQLIQIDENTPNPIIATLVLVKPLLNWARKNLRAGLSDLHLKGSDFQFDPKHIESQLLPALIDQYLTMISRTVVLELNIARLEEKLAGDTPEDRFQSYIKFLSEPQESLSLLMEYPVLARTLLLSTGYWVDFCLEFLQHLIADIHMITEQFGYGKDPKNLVSLQLSAGDTHRRGKSVVIAEFESGLKVVYKPRPLSLENHFQAFLDWINSKDPDLSFRRLGIIDRSSYGWVEFIHHESCKSESEIRHFYERQGGYLAILYALQAIDFHYENLIAARDQPILIDLESLFHPQLSIESNEPEDTNDDKFQTRMTTDSVMRIGLLPMRAWASDESDGMEISGLGGSAGQLTPKPISYWEDEGTDRMHIAKKQMEMPGKQNRPTLNGEDVDTMEYGDSILDGFTKVYHSILENKIELLSQNGPLSTFSGDEARVILRATNIYGLILNESYHPDVLRDALDRDRHFDRLWVGAVREPRLQKVIQNEREDLYNGDIPYFSKRLDNRHLLTSTGEQIVNFYDESSLDLVKRRIESMSESDLEKQRWFIKASLTALSTDTEHSSRLTREYSEPERILGPEELIDAAKRVGDRLIETVLMISNRNHWMGVTLFHEKFWTLAPVGLDLYNGLPGIALFLGYLGHITGDKSYTKVSRSTVNTVIGQMENAQFNANTMGIFNGLSGIIYTFVHLGALWNDKELITAAKNASNQLFPLINEDRQFNILSGSSGCIGSMLALHHCKPDDQFLDIANTFGDRLLASAVKMKSGWGWLEEGMNGKPLGGFSHGASGCAWALLKLATITGSLEFREAGFHAMRYEDSLFDHEFGNWRDLRKDPEDSNDDNDNFGFMSAWCHGAPGIGMSRLSLIPDYSRPLVTNHLDDAIDTTMKVGFKGNHSLCHGSLGNLELIHMASRGYKPELREEVKRAASQIVESIKTHGYITGVPRGVETPGLMTGITGIGYQLLRLAEPEQVPSILVLEPPPDNL